MLKIKDLRPEIMINPEVYRPCYCLWMCLKYFAAKPLRAQIVKKWLEETH